MIVRAHAEVDVDRDHNVAMAAIADEAYLASLDVERHDVSPEERPTPHTVLVGAVRHARAEVAWARARIEQANNVVHALVVGGEAVAATVLDRAALDDVAKASGVSVAGSVGDVALRLASVIGGLRVQLDAERKVTRATAQERDDLASQLSWMRSTVDGAHDAALATIAARDAAIGDLQRGLSEVRAYADDHKRQRDDVRCKLEALQHDYAALVVEVERLRQDQAQAVEGQAVRLAGERQYEDRIAELECQRDARAAEVERLIAERDEARSSDAESCALYRNCRKRMEETERRLRALAAAPNVPEIRLSPDGAVDKVCARGVDVHLELMGRHHVWIGITPLGGETLHLNVVSAVPPRRKQAVVAVRMSAGVIAKEHGTSSKPALTPGHRTKREFLCSPESQVRRQTKRAKRSRKGGR